MYESILEIDLHGRNAYQARVAIDAALRRASAGVYRIRVIHGCNSGTALRELVRDRIVGAGAGADVERVCGDLDIGALTLRGRGAHRAD